MLSNINALTGAVAAAEIGSHWADVSIAHFILFIIILECAWVKTNNRA